MSETLFDGYEPMPQPKSKRPGLSADQRRTMRQAERVAAGIHPLTGGRLHILADKSATRDDDKAAPFKCGSCYFRTVAGYHGRSYSKCIFPENWSPDQLQKFGYPRVTHGAASDIRAWWPACPDYTPGDSISPDAMRSFDPNPTTTNPESEAS